MEPKEYEGLIDIIAQLHPAAQVAAVLGIAACFCMVVWGFVKFWNGSD